MASLAGSWTWARRWRSAVLVLFLQLHELRDRSQAGPSLEPQNSRRTTRPSRSPTLRPVHTSAPPGSPWKVRALPSGGSSPANPRGTIDPRMMNGIAHRSIEDISFRATSADSPKAGCPKWEIQNPEINPLWIP